MGVSNILNTGFSGLVASKAGIATAGHNIANVNTDGYSRQRILAQSNVNGGSFVGESVVGNGTKIARIERVNDQYLEKQIFHAQNEMDYFESKDLILKQVEDIFNEVNEEGIGHWVAAFFNEFRKLAQEPDNLSLRQSLSETTQALTKNFNRVSHELQSIRDHIDSKINVVLKEFNSLLSGISDLNSKIKMIEINDSSPNDLLDQRDVMLKKIESFADVVMYQDESGSYHLNFKEAGMLLNGKEVAELSSARSAEGLCEIRSSGAVQSVITHKIHGGKLGALLELRDQTLDSLLSRLDTMAFTLTEEVNALHEKGVSYDGRTQIVYFKKLDQSKDAAANIGLSDEIIKNVDSMVTGYESHAPGDNRVAIAISQLQDQKLIGDSGRPVTLSEWYNALMSELGVLFNQNNFAYHQQKDIMNQLSHMREQISGVSIDEETTQLLQFQQMFDASAKLIQASDEMMKTILSLKRD